MHSFEVSSLVFMIVFGGAIAVDGFPRALPPEHLGTDAKDKSGLPRGVTAVTMTLALCLGCLFLRRRATATAKKTWWPRFLRRSFC